jgi:hypothetical protein
MKALKEYFIFAFLILSMIAAIFYLYFKAAYRFDPYYIERSASRHSLGSP